MFDPAICCRKQLAALSTVSCEALLDLKTVLQCALPPDREVRESPADAAVAWHGESAVADEARGSPKMRSSRD